MNFDHLLDTRARTAFLFTWMFLLWLFEQRIPLVPSDRRKIGANLLLTFALIATNLSCATLMVFLSQWVTAHRVGAFQWLGAPVWLQLAGGVLLLDFWAAYVIHVLSHKIGWLWRIHRVHHSDPMVDVTTAFRQHPLESLLRISFLLSGMVFLGLPLWIVAVYQSLSSFNALLEHANIRVHPGLDRRLRSFLVTPNYHKIHHSRWQHETDSNYGNIFSLWDRMFSTTSCPATHHDISYGLDTLDEGKRFTFWELIKLPFKSD
jgi:sterol desaturase/sphingolipid hydroxylase (fatty acid hydroxylase superfamily)